MTATPKRATRTNKTGTTGKPRKGVVKENPSDPEIEERRRLVASLILARRSVTQIARSLGVDRSTIHRDLKAIRGEWQQERLESFERHLDEELARLAMLEATLMPLALGTNGNRPDPRVVDRLLRIIEQRARWLGFDKPHRIEVTGAGGGPVEVEQVDRTDLLMEIERLSERLAATRRDEVPTEPT